VKITFDNEIKAAYIYLSSAPVSKTKEVYPGIIVDFDEFDKVRGIKILNVSQTVGQISHEENTDASRI
jgi:uncharacterized protein YuzE